MKAGGLASLVVVAGCFAAAGFASSTGCNGTGTTPVCDFADGANDPEAGCGVLIEASVDAETTDAGTIVQSGTGADATSPHVSDAAPE